MSEEKIVTAALLIVGNEILSGRTKDANLSVIATGLNEVGVRLSEARVVPDIADMIIGAVNELRARYDYVFTTGGIGPTHDDITSECVARAFGVKLILHPEAHAILAAHYKPGELNAARLRMAHVPEGASLVANPVSRAPGFRIGNVFVLAGVPMIMQAMFESIRNTLVGGRKVLSYSVSCFLGEGILAEGLGALQQRYPDLDIGSYPSFRRGGYGVALVLRGPDIERLRAAARELVVLIRDLGGDPIEEPPAS